MRVSGPYLHIPVKAGDPLRTIRLSVGDEVVRAFEVELAVGAPDYWSFTDVTVWRGQEMVVTLDPQPANRDPEIRRRSAEHPLAAGALSVIEVGEELKHAAELYREALRPQFHFSTRRGWTNDPNGMVYHEGEYHLFFQLQPFSVTSAGDKSWGHAVSRDLVHWEERPIALYADAEGSKWSGSSVVDSRNVSGLQVGAEPPLLLFYTATGCSAHRPKAPEPDDYVQSIACSHDRGRTWETWAGNPFMHNVTPGNRDPWVFWHEPAQHWVMTLYVGQPESWSNNRNEARIYSSTNLREWCHESTVEGFFDCPILFSLPLDGDENDLRWIMHCADMKYRVGRFDGCAFTPETDLLVGQVGECAYAPQLFNHAPDNRRIQIAWGRTTAPGMPFSQIMTFPCDLSLVATDEGPRIKWTPVAEIKQLHTTVTRRAGVKLLAGAPLTELARTKHGDLQVVIDLGAAVEVTINVRGARIVCDVGQRRMTCGDFTAPLRLPERKWHLRVLVDRLSLEIFADGGLVYMPLGVVLPLDNDLISIEVRGGDARLDEMNCHELASIWPVA